MHVTQMQFDEMLRQRDELQQKLDEVLLEVGEAGGTSDWHDNAALEHAQHEAALLRGKMRRLLDDIDAAQIVEHVEDVTTVRVGHQVVVQLDDEEDPETYTILGPLFANPLKGIISTESPLGQALLGKPVGSRFSFRAPVGMLSGEILAIQVPESL